MTIPASNERNYTAREIALAILLGMLAGGIIGGCLWYLDWEIGRLFK